MIRCTFFFNETATTEIYTLSVHDGFLIKKRNKRKKKHEELLERIKSKKQKNRLIVDESSKDDNSVVAIHPDTMDELQLFRGDTVKIVGKKRHDTICIVLSDEECEKGKIKMNKVVRKNLRMK